MFLIVLNKYAILDIKKQSIQMQSFEWIADGSIAPVNSFYMDKGANVITASLKIRI